MKDRLDQTIGRILLDNIWDSIERPVFNFTNYGGNGIEGDTQYKNSIFIRSLFTEIGGIVDRTIRDSVRRAITDHIVANSK